MLAAPDHHGDPVKQVYNAFWRAACARRDRRTGVSLPLPHMVPNKGPTGESRLSPHFPAMDHLDLALELAGKGELRDLVHKLAEVRGSLVWSQNASYDRSNCDAAFLNGYAYGALSGPDGFIPCAAPRCGFLLLAPHVTYPAHNHGPIEIYMMLTPGGQWQLDGGEWFPVAPGELIYHGPWQLHGMRTTDHPMLAFAAWPHTGDRRAVKWA